MEFNNYEKMGKNNYYRVLDTLIDKEQDKAKVKAKVYFIIFL
jgi:hypothetical protein